MCSMESTADTMAVMTATLANGGICPLTSQRVVSNRACRDTLSLMHSCGMYDYSGQWAFKVRCILTIMDPFNPEKNNSAL